MNNMKKEEVLEILNSKRVKNTKNLSSEDLLRIISSSHYYEEEEDISEIWEEIILPTVYDVISEIVPIVSLLEDKNKIIGYYEKSITIIDRFLLEIKLRGENNKIIETSAIDLRQRILLEIAYLRKNAILK